MYNWVHLHYVLKKLGAPVQEVVELDQFLTLGI